MPPTRGKAGILVRLCEGPIFQFSVRDSSVGIQPMFHGNSALIGAGFPCLYFSINANPQRGAVCILLFPMVQDLSVPQCFCLFDGQNPIRCLCQCCHACPFTPSTAPGCLLTCTPRASFSPCAKNPLRINALGVLLGGNPTAATGRRVTLLVTSWDKKCHMGTKSVRPRRSRGGMGFATCARARVL